ncbi:MAG: tRNA (adenosine(37)-N6)-threonylcarbamoyltransferase complex ATPase subunit type 1 TsaE [Gammaproteobacteria bacterium]|nr:tRNA (adenosine(37)-N6)-threonylcarbamoyltransferase complex ATPase subunit type 1 TsaE [Gammaproteobacteria bacterium]
MDALGVQLGHALSTGAVVFLSGELGSGKTTLVRGVLRGLGITVHVRSPTYTLMENYELHGRVFQHLDLYRIRDAGELEFLGVRELDDPERWIFVEWPERGLGHLPQPDLELELQLRDSGRQVVSTTQSEAGRRLVAAWRSMAKDAGIPGLTVLD